MTRAATSPTGRDGPSHPRLDRAVPRSPGRSAETIHDLRNMLAIIVSGTQVLGRHEASRDMRDVIDAMQNAAQTAGQLIARLAAESADRDTAGSTPRKGSAVGHPSADLRLRS